MSNLKSKLEYHYRVFDKTKISPDPLEFPHKFNAASDIEVAAFISSVFAYGNVKQIIKSLNTLFEITGNELTQFILEYKQKKNLFKGIKHRFFTDSDIDILFRVLNTCYTEYGSLKNLFLLYYFENETNLKNSIYHFNNNLIYLAAKRTELTGGLKFMFPNPYKGSACKRMNLFLRWMVRKDELDFGLWYEIPTNKLIIPVDTHIAKICKELKLTKKKIVNWKMAEEITNNLKKYSAKDPVKYDFAICHIGMRKMKF